MTHETMHESKSSPMFSRMAQDDTHNNGKQSLARSS